MLYSFKHYTTTATTHVTSWKGKHLLPLGVVRLISPSVFISPLLPYLLIISVEGGLCVQPL